MGKNGLETTNQPLHSPEDFNLYRPMKVFLGNRKFQTDDEHKRCVLNCIRSQDKDFYISSICNVSGPQKNVLETRENMLKRSEDLIIVILFCKK
jgi:hypothetical protein